MIVEDQVTVKPVIEATQSTLPAYDLKMGKIYVVPEKAYEVFTDQITHGVEGLCITHLAPEEVRRRWGFKETPIIKLAEEKGKRSHIASQFATPLHYHKVFRRVQQEQHCTHR